MKKLFSITLLLFSALLVQAQESTKKRAEVVIANMDKQLALTREQEKEILQLTVAKLETLAGLKKSSNKDYELKYLLEVRMYQTQVREKLNEEQYKKWFSLRNEQLALRKEGKPVPEPVIDEETEILNKTR